MLVPILASRTLASSMCGNAGVYSATVILVCAIGLLPPASKSSHVKEIIAGMARSNK